MFLPFADYPNPNSTPWVTRMLIAVNVAIHIFVSLPLESQAVTADMLVTKEAQEGIRLIAEREQIDYDRLGPRAREQFLAQVPAYNLFTYVHGYKPARPSLADMLYCMFLHGGWMHLLGNMLFLWIYGDNIEDRLGRLGYLVGYLATGMAATALFGMLNPTSTTPLVGASGAISGVLGFYLIWFPDNRVKVLVWFYYFMNVYHIRAVWFLLLYVVVLQNLLPILTHDSGGVAHWAHIGGFGAGVLGAVIINLFFGRRPVPHPDVELRQRIVRPQVGGPTPARYREVVRERGPGFQEALRAGRMEEAAYAFAQLVRQGGATPPVEDVFNLGRWLYDNNFHRDAEQVFRYYIRNFPRGSDLDRAHLALGLMMLHSVGQKAAAREHLLTAIDLAIDPATAETARAALG